MVSSLLSTLLSRTCVNFYRVVTLTLDYKLLMIYYKSAVSAFLVNCVYNSALFTFFCKAVVIYCLLTFCSSASFTSDTFAYLTSKIPCFRAIHSSHWTQPKWRKRLLFWRAIVETHPFLLLGLKFRCFTRFYSNYPSPYSPLLWPISQSARL